MPNDFSHLYQLDEFNSNLGLLGGNFYFIQIVIGQSAITKDPDLNFRLASRSALFASVPQKER